MGVTQLLLLILACILLIGFFAGMEIAFISANKLNIELKKKQGKLSGRILAGFMENPEEFIGTALVGVNVVLVIYGLLTSQLTTTLFAHYHIHLPGYAKLLIDTFLATVIILVFAEFLPKAIFRHKAETVLTFFSVPMRGMHFIFSPIARVFVSVQCPYQGK